MKKGILLIALTLGLAGCSKSDKSAQSASDNIAAPEAETIKIVRLDSIAANLTDSTEVEEAFFTWMTIAGDSNASPAEFAGRSRIKAFLPEVANVFSSTDSLAQSLSRVMQTVGKGRRVYSIVSPYVQSIVLMGDTAVFVALNHYLGAEHPAYNGFPEYVRQAKVPTRIAPDIAEAIIATSHPMAKREHAPVIARLLYEGAVVESVMRATGMSEREVLGYTDSQMKWADDNEAQIWRELMKRKMLFTTDPAVADRLLNPAPSTSILNSDSPGRLGRFTGHRLVQSYLSKHPEADLLSPDFYNGTNTLADAGYNPE